jgi:hydrogenase nickel incorporation protein HypB
MCATCGCDGNVAHDHHHHHHDHDHDHPHVHKASTVIRLERDVLDQNARIAKRNRGWLAERRIMALNLMSSPGAGKTTLLERTIRDLGNSVPIHVVEGDQATDNDAARIRAAGANAFQINTGQGCHLDAKMVSNALEALSPPAQSMLMIENVGNLVCPALFDLGEAARVVIASVTEGDDKPLKYPHMFHAADLVVLNKIDLAPHVPFDVETFFANARRVRPEVQTLSLSAWRGDGLPEWYAWLKGRAA